MSCLFVVEFIHNRQVCLTLIMNTTTQYSCSEPAFTKAQVLNRIPNTSKQPKTLQSCLLVFFFFFPQKRYAKGFASFSLDSLRHPPLLSRISITSTTPSFLFWLLFVKIMFWHCHQGLGSNSSFFLQPICCFCLLFLSWLETHTI